MPISAAFIAAASLIPSPINPTVWPFSRRTETTRAFWSGVSFANTSVVSAAFASWASDISSRSEPRSILRTSRPTCLQMVRVTLSLSPVRIFVVTPCAFNARIASEVDSFGGSRNARYPISTISLSSFTPNAPAGEGLLFCAMASTRKPLSFSPPTVCKIRLRTVSVSTCTVPSHSAKEQIESISSTAPFVTICVLPFLSCTTVVRRRRVKSNGISSTFT